MNIKILCIYLLKTTKILPFAETSLFRINLSNRSFFSTFCFYFLITFFFSLLQPSPHPHPQTSAWKMWGLHTEVLQASMSHICLNQDTTFSPSILSQLTLFLCEVATVKRRPLLATVLVRCRKGIILCLMGFPGDSECRESACNVRDLSSIPGSGRSHGEQNGYPFPYSCLENSIDRGAWRAIVHGIPKSQD